MRNRSFSLGLILALLGLAACTGSAATSPTISSTLSITDLSPGATLQTPTRGATLQPPAPANTTTPTSTDTATPLPQVTLAAVGDIMLGRTVGGQLLAKGPAIVFAGVKAVLDSADLRVGNLECAITERDQSAHKSFALKAPYQATQALWLAKFDVLGVANNHAMDFGYAGLTDTQNSLSQYGISTVGAGSNFFTAHAPVFIEKNGLRLAFLAYVDVLPENSGFDPRTWIATGTSPGIAWADPAQIKADVAAAKRHADVVIVLLHGGIEITDVINNITNKQREEARAAIDAGAALVIGSHPHVLQQIENYHGGLIAYSLGNFVFDQYRGVADATIILRVVLTRDGFHSYNYVPVLIENGLPHVTEAKTVPAIGTLVAPPPQ